MTGDDKQALLRRLMDSAVRAADPMTSLAQHLPDKPKGRCIILGAGKSAASMARAVELAWPDVDLSGLVVTRYGHSVPTDRIEVVEASHPVPDEAGAVAAERLMGIAQTCGPDDLVLALISGGGSSLLPLPLPPLTLEDEILVNKLLLASGLAIDDMNRVRRRISAIKGGGLARAIKGARLVTLAISDVPGDDPAAIASGPTVPDPSAADDLGHLVDRLGPDLPDAVRELLLKPAEQAADFDVDYRMIATPMLSLRAAAEQCKADGVTPLILGDALEGEASEMGTALAGIALSVKAHDLPIYKPAVLLSGGEGTVTIGDTKPGKGGRNSEFLLSLAIALNGCDDIHALAVDTDGIDGSDDAAGAIIGPDTLNRLNGAGVDAKQMLTAHDSYSAFDAIDALIRTGPTLTNVNDFRAILIT